MITFFELFFYLMIFLIPISYIFFQIYSKIDTDNKEFPLIQYLGHSGMIISYENINILIDPWFDSAFLNSWFPYPYNNFLKEEILKKKIDYIWFSHAHEDHFSVDFLKNINKDIPILIAKFKGKNLYDRLKKLNFNNIIEINHKEKYNISNKISLKIICDTTYKEDSSLFIDFNNEYTFLNTNDCNNTLIDLPKNVDFMTCQFSGAQWYPQCYNYSPEIMNKKIQDVSNGLKMSWENKIKYVKPKFYIPSGGPPCFLNEQSLKLNYQENENTIFIPFFKFIQNVDQQIFEDTKILYLEPGDIMENNKIINKHLEFDNKFYNLNWYKKQINLTNWSGGSINFDKINKYFQNVKNNNKNYLKNNFFEQILIIKTETKIFKIKLDSSDNNNFVNEISEKDLIYLDNNNEEYYLFNLKNKVLNKIINLECDWEEALLSTLVQLDRKPDIYDPNFQLFLRHCNYKEQMDNIKATVNKKEMFIPESNPDIQIQRWCPHMGEDLTNAKIINGTITCPRHGWVWDITSGECLKGGNLCLNTKKLDW